MPRLTLIGYRGCGKSTVAALVAARLGCGWLDADSLLEEHVGCSITDFIRERGEAAFRDEEAALLAATLPTCTGVLATGGGVVLRPANRDLLRASGRPVVWLTAPATVIRDRLAADPTTRGRRPALTGSDPLAEVEPTLIARDPLYRECADRIIDTSQSPPAAVADTIVGWLAEEERP